MKQYISIQQVDNGWIIERNAYSEKGKREKVVCSSPAEVSAHIDRMVNDETSDN